MNDQSRKVWQYRRWKFLVAAIVLLVAYNAILLWQEREMRFAIFDLHMRNLELEDEQIAIDRLRWRISEANKESRGDIRRRKEQLQTCTSLDDFVTNEGPRIVFGELRGGPDNLVRIGLYLPAGQHRLKYAACDTADMILEREVSNLSGTRRYTITKGSGLDRKQFQSGDTRNLGGVTCFELGSEPGLYEIQLQSASKGGPLRLSANRQGGSLPLEYSLPLQFDAATFHTMMAPNTEVYPNQRKGDVRSLAKLHQPLPLPVADLAVISVCETTKVREVDIRLWIESDGPGCMSAIEVAADYLSLSDPLAGAPMRSKVMIAESADHRFLSLFEPYDGSNRLYFRRGIFANQD